MRFGRDVYFLDVPQPRETSSRLSFPSSANPFDRGSPRRARCTLAKGVHTRQVGKLREDLVMKHHREAEVVPRELHRGVS